MKKIVWIVGTILFFSIFFTFLEEIRYFVISVLIIGVSFLLLAGFFGFRWLQEWVGIKREEKLKLKAERLKTERETEFSTIITPDNQLHIRETNHEVIWRAAHLDRRLYANGHHSYADERDIAAWMAWNFRNSPAQLPNLISPTEEDIIEQPSRYKRLNEIDFIHMLIVGPSGSGKTTVANWEIDNFPPNTTVYALDPHEKFNTWSPRATVIGNGRNFEGIDQKMGYLLDIMDKRYSGNQTQFEKVLIVADEWLSILDNCKRAQEFFKLIGSEARKVNMHLIIMTISATVDDLNCSAAVRENLVQLNLKRPLNGLGELKWNKKESEIIELPGPYHYQGLLESGLDNIELDSGPSAVNLFSLTEKQRQVVDLWLEGIRDKKELAKMVYGNIGGSQYSMIDKALSQAGLQ
ncbi:hypothetical protein C4588_02045 [Candidatus Parcubacteria bacterium]|nr:MAG: hypothetical protein C4588_02045 [Candidatus Parcubacteria bacterium]